jgi:Flp pilus assembly protein TadG
MRRSQRDGSRGQVAALLAMFIVPLVGMSGLAVDLGRMYTARLQAQAAADLAASAGAHEATRPAAESNTFEVVALEYAARNGFSSAHGDTVQLNNPPSRGAYAGNPDAYEVVVERPVDTMLLQVLTRTSPRVQGRAVVVLSRSSLGILVLDPAACNAFQMTGQTRLALHRGMLHVNSTCANRALHVQGGSELDTSAQPATVVGGARVDGGSIVTPTPEEGAEQVDDPLGAVPDPSFALPVQRGNPGATRCRARDAFRPGNGQTLCPGIYYCGIDVRANRAITLDPCGVPPSEAVFVLAGHGLTVQRNASVSGAGIMLFNTRHPQLDNGGQSQPCGRVRFHTTATTTLTAPEDGTYQGLVLFQARECAETIQLAPGPAVGLAGEVYAAGAQVDLRGTNANTPPVSLHLGFIVGRLRVDRRFSADVTPSATFGSSGRRVLVGE